MMKRFSLLTFLLIGVISTELFPQAKIENKLTFYDAESWLLFEDYKEALDKYLTLFKFYPNNNNIKYRIGQCYINIPGEKQKAISFLEDAVKNINPKYKEGKFKETRAPYDAYYYLANAYRINNQLDKAIETYKIFKKNLNPKVYDSTIVNVQIQSCYNAKELMSIPLFIREKNLGNSVNETRSELNPVVSDDEKMMIYTQELAFYDAIMFSTKTNNEWSAPLNMNELLKVDYDYYPTSLSSDGKTLYMYSSQGYDGVIFSSTFENGTWGPPVKLNDNINTKYWESHATISHNNKKLYFTSNRKGTIGKLDIYVSERDSSGNWGPAVNLGPVINTEYNEETPFLSKDDKTLFFSSRGHFNMGGYDIFYSTLLDNGQWSVPLNVGYPLNSTDDDVFFNPVHEGYEGYYAIDNPEGFGKQDIYRIEMFSDDHPRKFLIRGMVKVADLILSLRDSVKISAMNIKDPNQTVVVYSDPRTGEFEFTLPQGNYQITYESPVSEKIKRDLNLNLTDPSDSFVLPGTILPKTDFVADLNVESNKTISVTAGDSILFPVKVEPGSILVIEHRVGDSLIYSEQFTVADSVFYYKMAPQRGDNKVTFKLTDRFSNTTTTDVFITREKGITTQPVIRPEYSRIIAKKQIAALTEMLRNRADEKLRKVINNADIQKQQFGKVDDLVSYIKEEAAKSSISPAEVDKLALRVAVMDNVLTQAAVDAMAKYYEGDLKNLLNDIDIYQANLKTWTDLQEYIARKTNNKIAPADLNKLASDILSETDPAIKLIREKILAYSENSSAKTLLSQTVTETDLKKIKRAGSWVRSFSNESVNKGLKDNHLAEMFATISSLPDAKIEQFIKDFSDVSEDSLRTWLSQINLKSQKIKAPADLILLAFRTKGANIFSDEVFFNSLAQLISSKNIPEDIIRSQAVPVKGIKLWYLWLLPAGAIIFLFIIFYRRTKKNKEQN